MVTLAHMLIIVVTINFFLLKKRKSNNNVFFDMKLYLLIMSILYLSLPAMIQELSGVSRVLASDKQQLFLGIYSVYFVSLMLISYVFLSSPVVNIELNVIRFPMFYVAILCIIIFVLSIAIWHVYSNAGSCNQNRLCLSDLNLSTQRTYKLTPLFYMYAIILLYFTMVSKNIKYILLFFPFLVYDFVVLDRGFIISIFIFSFFMFLICGKTIKLIYPIACSIMILFIGYIRLKDTSGLNVFLVFSGEFINTYEVGNLALIAGENNEYINTVELFIVGFFKFLPDMLTKGLLGDYAYYRELIVAYNPLPYELGGGVLGEAIFTGNYVIMLLYPILFIAYASLINRLLKYRNFLTLAFFIISITTLFTVFRSGIIYSGLYPVSVFIYSGLLIYAINLLPRRNIS